MTIKPASTVLLLLINSLLVSCEDELANVQESEPTNPFGQLSFPQKDSAPLSSDAEPFALPSGGTNPFAQFGSNIFGQKPSPPDQTDESQQGSSESENEESETPKSEAGSNDPVSQLFGDKPNPLAQLLSGDKPNALTQLLGGGDSDKPNALTQIFGGGDKPNALTQLLGGGDSDTPNPLTQLFGGDKPNPITELFNSDKPNPITEFFQGLNEKIQKKINNPLEQDPDDKLGQAAQELGEKVQEKVMSRAVDTAMVIAELGMNAILN